jgi:hypothetical protein
MGRPSLAGHSSDRLLERICRDHALWYPAGQDRRGRVPVRPRERPERQTPRAGPEHESDPQSVTPINVGSGLSVTPKLAWTPSRSSRASAISSFALAPPRLTIASVCLCEMPTRPLP